MRVERATFYDLFITSCLQSSMTAFRQKDGLPRSWSYIHVVAACEPKEKCGLTVLLNNFAENEQLKNLIESQTKRYYNPNETTHQLVRGAFEMIRFLTMFGKL